MPRPEPTPEPARSTPACASAAEPAAAAAAAAASIPAPASSPAPRLAPEAARLAGARRRVVIAGAAGRDFHDFNVAFRDRADVEVRAFTAAQIPNIAGRRYPPALAGPLYPEGLPIHAEGDLEAIIEREGIDEVVLSYSDLSHEAVMHLASRALARGADFRLLGPRATMLAAARPVVSVCAARTGAGKSPVTRRVAALLREAGLRVAVVRHPMPYGDLARQAVQRFGSVDDLDRHACTIEEREEYEPHLAAGHVVFAGVDYERILRAAERESDAIVWDGGNNDLPFFRPDLEVVVLDPHRAGHETAYHPGEVNLLRADVAVVSKVDTATAAAIAATRRSIGARNPRALVVEVALPPRVDDPERVRGRRALIVEDGPTLTHGGLPSGAGLIAAERLGARPVDPRAAAVGSLRDTFERYPHIGPVLPAMGYGAEQVADLEETIRRAGAEVVVAATPADLTRVLRVDGPVARVRYEAEDAGAPTLADALAGFIARARSRARGEGAAP